LTSSGWRFLYWLEAPGRTEETVEQPAEVTKRSMKAPENFEGVRKTLEKWFVDW